MSGVSPCLLPWFHAKPSTLQGECTTHIHFGATARITYLPAFIFSFQSHRGEQLTLTTDAEEKTTVSGLIGEVANFTKENAAVITVDGTKDTAARGHFHIIDLVFVPREATLLHSLVCVHGLLPCSSRLT